VTVALLVLAALAAVGDWYAVARRLRHAEYVAKPLTLLLLLVAADSADLGPAKALVLAALALGLLGDIALLFADEHSTREDENPDSAFLIGLSCFLLGHLAYVVAFVRHGLHPVQVLAGVLVVAGAATLALPKILRGADRDGGPTLAVVVGGYSAALGAMAVLGFGTAAVATALGALLFLASDITLAWNRFVQALRRGPVLVAVTYHLAQLLIVIGLVRR
jgi:uncharacterized membrane protein YhhN